MVSALVYLPFRIVWRPTVWVGRVVAWLAEGYRTATPLERVLIFPSWAVLRGVFIAGWALATLLHTAARHTLER
jgi:cobalamin biosynthesis protein CobD/CbiB